MKTIIDAAARHRPIDPEYFRDLIARAGLTQVDAARRIGVDPRTMRRYLAGDAVPYPVQVTLEILARQA
ncbi:MAG: helix-turn-helix domain-containing protein [Fluviibacter sp.]